MALVRNTYGKGRVRVMRVKRDGDRHEVRELTVKAMLEGDFAPAYTDADNSAVVATDTIKNIVNIVARENIGLDTEAFVQALARRYLDRYAQVEHATITAWETRWVRFAVGGVPHSHSFLLDGNGKPFAHLVASREAHVLQSGIEGFTFMKSTASGWENYVRDEYTTLPETRRPPLRHRDGRPLDLDSRRPTTSPTANLRLLTTMLEVFATTYSASVQDSLYRMGEAALEAVPEIGDITMVCPNKHYLPLNLSPFGMDNPNAVFTPTDEPHGQIECTVARDDGSPA